jgi:serine/threonine protein kinase
MELDLLERRIRRLVSKLAKQNIHLEVFDHNDIEYGPTLGKGGEGIVQRCTVRYNDLPVEAAVKTLLNNSDDALTITLDEIELLCLARDPIVTTTLQVYGVAAVPESNDPTTGHLVIITEAGIKNALQLYKDEGFSIPLHVTYDLWSRLAGSVHCIHSKRIIHRDLKPENILVTGIIRDIHGNIEKIDFKVIDLGMGRRFFSDRVVSNDILGTNGYHAPEMLFDDSYDSRADIFMLGVTFCVMLLPASSLRKATLEALLKKVHEAKEQKIFGRALFSNVFEPAVSSGAGSRISVSVRNMICTMLERIERRSITLLDILSLCHRESFALRYQDDHRSYASHTTVCQPDSGIDSIGENMASQRTLHKIGLLESHALRQPSPRRLRSNKKRSPPVRHYSESTSSDGSRMMTPRKRTRPQTVRRKPSTTIKPVVTGMATRRKTAVRRLSVSTTSSEASHHAVPPRKKLAITVRSRSRGGGNMSGGAVRPSVGVRETRQSSAAAAKRLFLHDCDNDDEDNDDDDDDDYDSETETKAPRAKRRVLRSSSHCL